MHARMNRRHMLKSAAAGFGYLALAGLAAEAAEPKNPLALRASHHPAKAKRIIFVFMHGGPSQVDTFDYKPRLQKDDGMEFAGTLAKGISGGTGRKLMASPWQFAQHGESGAWVSD